jgi:hypothetical protein
MPLYCRYCTGTAVAFFIATYIHSQYTYIHLCLVYSIQCNRDRAVVPIILAAFIQGKPFSYLKCPGTGGWI